MSEADTRTALAEYGRQLEALASDNADRSLVVLSELAKQPISVTLLSDTGIGKIVNNFGKRATNAAVQAEAKRVVALWKTACNAEGAAAPATPTPVPAGFASQTQNAPTPTVSRAESSGSAPAEPARRSSVNSNAISTLVHTGDAHRDSCIKALAKALDPTVTDETQISEYFVSLAQSIEASIYKLHNSEVSPKYKTAVRSKMFNLKQNEDFRKAVLNGSIPPEKVAVMTSEEMATKELNAERKKLTTEAMNDAQMPAPKMSKTDQLRCGKCGKRDASYFQLQTRSSDEPMTTFVTCNVCGHNWKDDDSDCRAGGSNPATSTLGSRNSRLTQRRFSIAAAKMMQKIWGTALVEHLSSEFEYKLHTLLITAARIRAEEKYLRAVEGSHVFPATLPDMPTIMYCDPTPIAAKHHDPADYTNRTEQRILVVPKLSPA
ncbi:transcription elongation factor A [Capsaspora owczarzaki ATCC 30864]|uniref:Transcription elongation factor A n=1 Tax=Capsaspora owczarzaki (strain ATCC 30864) TaxID=595528 RepID=A0A0D2X4D2_CAPO3|nr:transcription elongation factor A [Capsaspora owczarzaki ATCC 30864]KJE95854.1 transcription elongation factor A [Capsaspora owczarzaki ATCC 30864]|eukprot:XP_004345006.1 transcription elongation factor A [Capsaspora owczarzaki ATCC 30864]